MAQDFVPDRCLPLRSALDRFAQALQMSNQPAQVEIQRKLHNGLIRALVLRPDTGELLGIFARCWGTETALRWLETGTCLLPNENGEVVITAARFDMFYRPEYAPIFIPEDDLNRQLSDQRQQNLNSQEPSLNGPSEVASIAQSDQASLRELAREVYEQLWPDGFKGRAKERDQAIRDRFEQLNKTPPTIRTIQRALKGE